MEGGDAVAELELSGVFGGGEGGADGDDGAGGVVAGIEGERFGGGMTVVFGVGAGRVDFD